MQATLTDDARPLQAMERLRRPVPPHPGARVRAGGRRPRRGSARPHPGRSDHAIALDFVAELRGSAATDAESALLLDACDACCEDPDVDVLLTEPVG